MDLRSPDFDDQGPIPRECTCEGADRPPILEWTGVPEGVAELALTCEDPEPRPAPSCTG